MKTAIETGRNGTKILLSVSSESFDKARDILQYKLRVSRTISQSSFPRYRVQRENSRKGRRNGREREREEDDEKEIGEHVHTRGDDGGFAVVRVRADFAGQFISHYLRQCGYLGAKGRVRFAEQGGRAREGASAGPKRGEEQRGGGRASEKRARENTVGVKAAKRRRGLTGGEREWTEEAEGEKERKYIGGPRIGVCTSDPLL